MTFDSIRVRKTILALAARLAVIVPCVIVSLMSTRDARAQGAVDPAFEAMREKSQITTVEGAQVPLDARFLDDDGREIQLKDVITGRRPVLLSMVYFSCPSLCNLQMDAEVESLRQLEWAPGERFDVVVVSMDHRDDVSAAVHRKKHVLGNYGREGTSEGWHFLTGDEIQIRKLSDAIGFGFEWSEQQGEYMHSAGLFVVTPLGKISRVLGGIRYEPETVRMALNEAADGRLGSVWEHIGLLCVSWDPVTGQYSVTAWTVMRIGCVMAILLVLFVVLVARRGRKTKHTEHTVALGIQS